MLDEGQRLGREVGRKDRAGVGGARLRDIRAVILRAPERREAFADDLSAAGEKGAFPRRREFLRGDEIGHHHVCRLGDVLGHPESDRLADLRARIGDPEHVLVAFLSREQIRRRIRQHDRHALRGQIGRDRERDRRTDDPGHHVDAVRQHELAGLGEADVRLAFVVLVDQFDLAPGHLAAGLLDGVADAVELVFAEHGEQAGGRHQHADLQRIGSKRRSRCLGCDGDEQAADGDRTHEILPYALCFALLYSA